MILKFYILYLNKMNKKIEEVSSYPGINSILYTLEKGKNVSDIKQYLKEPIIVNIDNKKYKFHEFIDDQDYNDKLSEKIKELVIERGILNENENITYVNENFNKNKIKTDFEELEKNIIIIHTLFPKITHMKLIYSKNDYKNLKYSDLIDICNFFRDFNDNNDDKMTYNITDKTLSIKNNSITLQNIEANDFYKIIEKFINSIISYNYQVILSENYDKNKDTIKSKFNFFKNIKKIVKGKIIYDKISEIYDSVFKECMGYFNKYFDNSTSPQSIKIKRNKNDEMKYNYFGLSNISNSCYMNSLIQLLLIYKPFTLVLDDIDNINDDNFDEGNYKEKLKNLNSSQMIKNFLNKSPLIKKENANKLITLFKLLKKKIDGLQDKKFMDNGIMTEIFNTIGDISSFFILGEQHDPHELLSYLQINNFTNDYLFLKDNYDYNFYLCKKNFFYNNETNKEILLNKKIDNLGSIIDLKAKNTNDIKMNDLIEQFFDKETFEKENYLSQKELNVNNPNYKELNEIFNYIKENPQQNEYKQQNCFYLHNINKNYPKEILLGFSRKLAVKQTDNIFTYVKNTIKITDLETINIPFSDSIDNNETIIKREYSIKAVVIHLGNTATGGHYITYKKIDDNWYEFNDQNVFEENYSQIKDNIETNGTMYLYEIKK